MTRRREIGWGAVLVAVAMLLGVLLTAFPTLDGLDQWWHGVIGEVRTSATVTLAHILDRVGGGVIGVFVVPVLIGAVLWWLRGWRVGVFAVAVFAVSALLVQIAKHLFGRARPEDLMVVTDHGSFPSGHTANAATIAIVITLIFPRLITALLAVAWVLLMAFSRTVVSAHWLTDTLGGAMLGTAAGLLMAAALLPWATKPRQDQELEDPEQPAIE